MDNYIPFILIPFIFMGVRHYLKKKGDYTPLKKATLFIASFSYAVTELGRSFYRPFIYSNKLNDWLIADTIGNSFGTMTAVFMIITLSGSGTKRDFRIISIITAGLVVYELINLTGKTSIDINDMFATIIFGIISALIYSIILIKYGNQPGKMRRIKYLSSS